MKKYFPLAILDIMAIIVILFTAWLGNNGNWITTNLSVIGYWFGYEKWLIGWGWLTGVVFVSYLVYMQYLFKVKNRLCVIFTSLAGIFLIVGVYVPYQPEPYPILSNVHIILSLLAPFCVVAAIITLMVCLVKKGYPHMGIYFTILILLLIGAAVIFIKCTIITTLLEVYTVSAITAFLTALAFLETRK